MDPLSLLRDCVSNGKPWRIEGEEVVLDGQRVKKDEPTAWRKTGRKDAEDFYRLNDLALLAQIALGKEKGAAEPLKHTQYLREFGKLKLTGAALVAALDYGDVVKYLRGETATADQIDRSRIISRVGVGGVGGVGGEEDVLDHVDFRLGDLGRTTGLDGPALQELKNILEAKRRRAEEEATLGAAVGGEEEAWAVDARMHKLLKTDEQLVSDRNGVLLAPAADFKMAWEAVETAQKRAKEAAKKQAASGSGGGDAGGRRSSTGSSGGQGRRSSSGDGRGVAGAPSAPRGPRSEPIIIVPSDPSALLNLTNVADFLENAHFVGPQERGGARGKREKKVLITKKLDDAPDAKPLKFAVIDNPVWLQPHEWESVVAVVSNGKAWQLSDWKYNQPVDLFHRCFGAYVHYDDEPLRGEVKGWNVRFYKVSKTKRHMDGIAVSQFWMQLADWLKVHKPLYLLPVAEPSSSSSASGAARGAAAAAAAAPSSS